MLENAWVFQREEILYLSVATFSNRVDCRKNLRHVTAKSLHL